MDFNDWDEELLEGPFLVLLDNVNDLLSIEQFTDESVQKRQHARQ